MPEKKSNEKADVSPPEKTIIASDEGRGTEQDEKSPEDWFSEISAGMKGVSRKLLDHVPPEIRKKVIEKARTHGPGSAAIAVNAAALKTRNLKAKLALKALGGLLKLLDSKGPKK